MLETKQDASQQVQNELNEVYKHIHIYADLVCVSDPLKHLYQQCFHEPNHSGKDEEKDEEIKQECQSAALDTELSPRILLKYSAVVTDCRR